MQDEEGIWSHKDYMFLAVEAESVEIRFFHKLTDGGAKDAYMTVPIDNIYSTRKLNNQSFVFTFVRDDSVFLYTIEMGAEAQEMLYRMTEYLKYFSRQNYFAMDDRDERLSYDVKLPG